MYRLFTLDDLLRQLAMGVISEMYLFPAVAYCKSNRIFTQKPQTPTNRISIATVADHYATFTKC
jgi:hypothetical protein